jgi:3,4-dihydroxy 2-butanone 4-phosphate synthase/GTP cyclohydrolase II
MVEFSSVEDLLEEVARGGMVVMVDDEDRENEGDLVCSARSVGESQIAFMAREGRGLICLSLYKRGMDRLGLLRMRERGVSRYGTAFYESIEASDGVTTGISAADRARTIRVASSESARESSVVVPGHIFPVCADERGVLGRRGHTEASLDLSRLSGCGDAGVICEVMGDDGRMLRVEGLRDFCGHHGLKLGTIESLVRYREERGV